MTEKERKEWAVFNRFQMLHPKFPAGSVKKCEEPDFLIDAGNSILGIEVTDLYRSPQPGKLPEQATEGGREKCVNRVQQLYEAEDGPPLLVSVHFREVHIPSKRETPLAKEILEVLRQNIPNPGQKVWVEEGWGPDWRPLPAEVDSISIFNALGKYPSLFQAPGASRTSSLTQQDVQRAIDEKEKKYDKYRERSDAVWLLIGCDTGFLSTYFTKIEAAASFGMKTRFTRVFLVSLFENRLIEVGLAAEP